MGYLEEFNRKYKSEFYTVTTTTNTTITTKSTETNNKYSDCSNSSYRSCSNTLKPVFLKACNYLNKNNKIINLSTKLLSKYKDIESIKNSPGIKLTWLLRLPVESDSEYLQRCIIHTKFITLLNKGTVSGNESINYPISSNGYLYYPYFKLKEIK